MENLNDLKKLTWFPYCLPASLDFMRVACKVDTRGRKIVLRSKDLEENWKKRNRYQLVSEQMENKKKKLKLKQVRLEKYWNLNLFIYSQYYKSLQWNDFFCLWTDDQILFHCKTEPLDFLLQIYTLRPINLRYCVCLSHLFWTEMKQTIVPEWT